MWVLGRVMVMNGMRNVERQTGSLTHLQLWVEVDL